MATEFNHNGNIYEIINDEEVRLTKLSDGCSGEICIPKYARYNDKQYLLTEIGRAEKYNYYERYNTETDGRKKPNYSWRVKGSSFASVFRKSNVYVSHYDLQPINESITSLIIPDSVTKIHTEAFSNCRGLRKLVLPDSIISIDEGAFWDCLELTELVIPNSVTSIGGSAFYGCRKLTKLVLPKGLSEIPTRAFAGCKSLSKLEIPNGVKIINGFQSIFMGFDANNKRTYILNETLTRLTIPSSVKEIGNQAFGVFKNLKKVEIYNEAGEVIVAGDAFPSTAKVNYLGKDKEKGFFARLADFIKNDDTPQEEEKTTSKVKAEAKAAPAPKAKVEPKVVEAKAKPAPKVKEESKAKVAKPVAKADGSYSKIQVNYRFNGDTAEKKVKMTLTKKVLDYATANGYDALEVAFDTDRIVLCGGGNILLQKVMDKALTITGYEWIE